MAQANEASNDELKNEAEGSEKSPKKSSEEGLKENGTEASDPLYVKELETRLALAQYKISDYEKKISDYQSKFSDVREYVKKMESEIEDIRSRAARDQDRLVTNKISQVFEILLPVIDNLELSIKSALEDDSALAKGVRLIGKQLQEVLQRAEVVRISTKGEPFDPEIHQAIVSRPVSDDASDGKILEEATAGYKYKDKIIRPAQVVVGQKNVKTN